MAKLDFCYTFYDGDAAKDTQFLDRLQRGAYYDILSAQRRFGHLEEVRIKQILANDFDHCWPALQLLLSVDDSNNFFIVWLDESVTKAKKHATKQKENITNRYKKDTNNVPNDYQNATKNLPNKNLVLPLENEDENKEENNLGKGMQGENPLQLEAEKPVLQKMLDVVKKRNSSHIPDPNNDFRELREIAEKLAGGTLDLSNGNLLDIVVQQFESLYSFAMKHDLYRTWALPSFNKHLSAINQAKNSTPNVTNSKIKKSSNQYIPTDTDYASSFNRGSESHG